MVEEMYLEEVKVQEQNRPEDNKTSNSEQSNDSRSKSTTPLKVSPVLDHNQSFKSKQENPPINQNFSMLSTSTAASSPPGFGFIGSSELDGIAHISPKRQRNTEMLHYISNVQSMNMDMKPSETNSEQVSMKFDIERQGGNGYSLMGGPAKFIGGFGSYPIGEISRYETEHYQTAFSGNAVSLTLGLPDNENISLSEANQSFFISQNIQHGRTELGQPNKFGNIIDTSSPSHSTPGYESISIQNRKRFAAQLLPDFVA